MMKKKKENKMRMDANMKENEKCRYFHKQRQLIDLICYHLQEIASTFLKNENTFLKCYHFQQRALLIKRITSH